MPVYFCIDFSGCERGYPLTMAITLNTKNLDIDMEMKKIIMIAALGLSSGFASAADFNFTGLGSAGAAAVQTVGGITVTVTATGGDSLDYLNLDGIGVDSGIFDLAALQSTLFSSEGLQVSFSEEVTIGSLGMRQWENGFDGANFSSSGGSFALGTSDSGFLEDFWDLSGHGVGALTSFTINGTGAVTATLLSSLTNVQVTAVPVPAAAWLLGSALIGLAGLGRKRSQ